MLYYWTWVWRFSWTHFVIVKALYGLRTSGAGFHEVLAKTLSKEGFVPSKADPDLWLRKGKNCYEYICVYIDDLFVVMHDPKHSLRYLKINMDKLKDVGNPEYYLRGDFGSDQVALYIGILRLILIRCSRYIKDCLVVFLVRSLVA